MAPATAPWCPPLRLGPLFERWGVAVAVADFLSAMVKAIFTAGAVDEIAEFARL